MPTRNQLKQMAKKLLKEGKTIEEVVNTIEKTGYTSERTGKPLSRSGVYAIVCEDGWASRKGKVKDKSEKKFSQGTMTIIKSIMENSEMKDTDKVAITQLILQAI
jgi:hypothetical protein